MHASEGLHKKKPTEIWSAPAEHSGDSFSNPFTPLPIMPSGVKHCRDNHGLFRFVHLIHNTIRETLRIAPSNILGAIPTAVQQRIFRQRIPNANDLLRKLCAQSRLARLIPSGGLRHVLLYFRAELNPPIHLENRSRSRVFISSNGTAESGSF